MHFVLNVYFLDKINVYLYDDIYTTKCEHVYAAASLSIKIVIRLCITLDNKNSNETHHLRIIKEFVRLSLKWSFSLFSQRIMFKKTISTLLVVLAIICSFGIQLSNAEGKEWLIKKFFFLLTLSVMQVFLSCFKVNCVYYTNRVVSVWRPIQFVLGALIQTMICKSQDVARKHG